VEVAAPPIESVTWTQYSVSDVSEAVVKESDAAAWSGLPVQLSPRYHAKVEYEPDPPEASALREAVCSWSIVAGETETEMAGLMLMVTVVVAAPPIESVTWTQ
jgi:hypothetical protein